MTDTQVDAEPINGAEPKTSAVARIDEVRAMFDRHRIRTVQFGMPDIDGVLRGKFVPADFFLESITRRGSTVPNIVFGWDIEDTLMDCLRFSGWQTGYSDVVLKPDLSTIRPIPWDPGQAVVLCDVTDAAGTPVEVAPRTVLQRQVEPVSYTHLTLPTILRV